MSCTHRYAHTTPQSTLVRLSPFFRHVRGRTRRRARPCLSVCLCACIYSSLHIFCERSIEATRAITFVSSIHFRVCLRRKRKARQQGWCRPTKGTHAHHDGSDLVRLWLAHDAVPPCEMAVSQQKQPCTTLICFM